MTDEGADDLAHAGHTPVQAEQVVQYLLTDLSGIYVDGTTGPGGHTARMLKDLTKDARVICFDRDIDAVKRARARLSADDRVTIVHSNYRRLAEVLDSLGIAQINGFLLDLGLSSVQLDDPSRGFAYRFDGPLDLRFDTSVGISAADWLNSSTEEEIAKVLKEYGEERSAKRIARMVVATRPTGIHTTSDLTAIVRNVSGPGGLEFGRSAARVFQALRIVVNDELAAIPQAMNDATDRLADGGRMVVISYHSLEDRIVKTFMHEAARECNCPPAYPQCMCGANQRGVMVERRAITPTDNEINLNPRARSAKMRVFERRSRLGGRR